MAGDDDKGNGLSAEDEKLIQDEFARQLVERREKPAAIYDAVRVAAESRARNVAYTQIAAHPNVKTALLMAEHLRAVALRADALLAYFGDPTRATDERTRLTVDPLLNELRDLCATFSGSPERRRDRLIDLIGWGAELIGTNTRSEEDWKRAISTLAFEIVRFFPDLKDNLTDEDLRTSVAAFIPKNKRPSDVKPLPKWEQLAHLIAKSGLGAFDEETIRTEYTKRRSLRRKEREARQAKLSDIPLGRKTDALTGETKEIVEERIRQIEARALRAMMERGIKPR